MKVDKQISIIQDTAERAEAGMNEAYKQGFRFLFSSSCIHMVPRQGSVKRHEAVIVTIILQKPEALDEKKLEVTRVVRLGEDDNLVVHVPRILSEKGRQHLIDSFKNCFPKDQPVLVLDDGMELGAIKRGPVRHIEQIWLECSECTIGNYYDKGFQMYGCKSDGCSATFEGSACPYGAGRCDGPKEPTHVFQDMTYCNRCYADHKEKYL